MGADMPRGTQARTSDVQRCAPPAQASALGLPKGFGRVYGRRQRPAGVREPHSGFQAPAAAACQQVVQQQSDNAVGQVLERGGLCLHPLGCSRGGGGAGGGQWAAATNRERLGFRRAPVPSGCCLSAGSRPSRRAFERLTPLQAVLSSQWHLAIWGNRANDGVEPAA